MDYPECAAGVEEGFIEFIDEADENKRGDEVTGVFLEQHMSPSLCRPK